MSEDKDAECKHPYNRIYFWYAYNYGTGKVDIPCAACCDCGKVLIGEIELESDKTVIL